jgi:hypothetical protein
MGSKSTFAMAKSSDSAAPVLDPSMSLIVCLHGKRIALLLATDMKS